MMIIIIMMVNMMITTTKVKTMIRLIIEERWRTGPFLGLCYACSARRRERGFFRNKEVIDVSFRTKNLLIQQLIREK